MSSYHSQNLSDGKLPLWRYGRAWWWRFQWGWNLLYPTSLLLLGIGRRGFCAYLRSFGFYLTWSRSDDYAERGRWEVAWSDGALRFEHPWVRQDGWSRSDPWWRKALRLPVSDWIFGKMRYEGSETETREVYIPMPEGCYRATAKHEVAVWRRRFGIVWHRRDSWNLDIPGGIPFSGKGENSWDCGDDGLFGIGGGVSKTLEEAIGECVASVLRSRRKYGHDSKRTGREPALVLNAERAAGGSAGAGGTDNG